MAQLLSQVAVGTVVKLNESGSPVNYLVVHQGLPSDLYDSSCNGTWLLRQDIAENRVWDSGNSNVLENSDIQSYLNGTWINRYDTDIRNAIKQVKIPYRQNGGSGGTDRTGANGLSCKIFLLSGYEVGFTTSVNQYFPVDGAKLAYFLSGNDSSAQQRRVANLNGSATLWWLRSPNTNGTHHVWNVYSIGNYDYWGAGNSYGVRPALVLSSTLYVEDDGTISVAPPAPDSITVPPSAIVGQSIAVSWAAVSGATQYKLERQADSGSWDTVYTGSSTSYTDTAQAGWQSVVYRVSAGVSGVFGETKSSSAVSVSVATPTGLTVPSALMVSQTATISWDAVTGADGYKLERQVNSAGEWSTLYTGTDLSYQDTAPSAAGTVTYRVSAGASGVYGVPATSAPVTVLAASALVISGTDGDLGTITAPVTYNVLTDTGNSVTVVENVDGTERTLTLTSGQEVSIPVARLTPGTGGITIKATVQSSSSPVSVTRTWTYSKTPASAPGGPYKVDQLQDQSGNMIAPQTLAEAVFLPSGESVAGRALSRNVVRTLPIAPGYSVSAGDVVDVNGSGQVAKNLGASPNTENVIFTGGTADTAVVKLSDQYSVAVFVGSAAANNGQAVLLNNNDGSKATNTFPNVAASGPISNVSLARLSDTQFVVFYKPSNESLMYKIGTVSETNISFSEQNRAGSSSNMTACAALAINDELLFTVETYSGSTFAYAFQPGQGTGTQYALGVYNAANFSATLLPGDASDNHRVCVCFSDSGDGNKGKAVIATIDSANQVTWGTVVTFYDTPSTNAINSTSCVNNGEDVYISFTLSGTSTYAFEVVKKITVSGTSFSPEMLETVIEEVGSYSSILNLSGVIVVIFAHPNNSQPAYVVTDGESDLSLGPGYQFNTSGSPYLSADVISENRFILAYADHGNSEYGTTTILEVMGNQIAGSFTDESSTAIALQSGTAGQSIECIFSGTTNAAWATEGQVIDSPGVYGVGIMDGILQVWSKERPGQVVTGSYVGTGTYGQSGASSLTVPTDTKLIIMLGYESSSGDNGANPFNSRSGTPVAICPFQMVPDVPNVFSEYFGFTVNPNQDYRAWRSRDTLHWYATSAINQFNSSGTVYHYMVIL